MTTKVQSACSIASAPVTTIRTGNSTVSKKKQFKNQYFQDDIKVNDQLPGSHNIKRRQIIEETPNAAF